MKKVVEKTGDIKIMNCFRFDPKKHIKGEVNKEPSLTIPNMTLSLKDLLARYTRGQDVVTLTPVFASEEELEDGLMLKDLEKMDYFEKRELAEQLGETLSEEMRRRRIAAEIRAKQQQKEKVKPLTEKKEDLNPPKETPKEE